MSPRPITPARDTVTLDTGNWVRGREFRNWRPEGTRDHLLIYTHRGRGRIGHAGRFTLVKPGQWLIFRPQTPQDYQSAFDPEHPRRPAAWGLIWIHVHPPPDWRALLDWPDIAPGIGVLHLEDTATRDVVKSALEEMVEHNRAARPRGKALAMNALERALLLADRARTDRAPTLLDPRLRPVLDLIHQRYNQPWTIEDLAAAAHLSPSRFAHLFREQLGLTPLNYIEGQRLQRARQLLEHTGLTIGQVAAEVGYDDAFYFSRRFRRSTGFSPRDYRQHAAPQGR